MMNNTKQSISVMFAGSPFEVLPPYVVYMAKHTYKSWCVGGPKGCRYGSSKSGWFDTELFEDWFESIVVPWASNLLGTKVVIGDNVGSHFSRKVLQLCKDHDIRFLTLPTNSTHLTQPLVGKMLVIYADSSVQKNPG